jgi:DNA-binding CsgD family transcriptional regulator/tetratricopeptide (TPR) repeat protein
VLTERAARAPVLLVLEDLHWADTSTLDLVVFLAHNVDERSVLLVGTYRAAEPSSAERMRRVADGLRRCGALHLELGPLSDDEIEAFITTRAQAPLPRVVIDAIVARAEGNPFFAQELLAAGGGPGDVPRSLGDVLLQRVERLDASTRSLLRLAAAAGRDVPYPLLQATAGLPEARLRASLRRAVEEGVLVMEPPGAGFRFRHALLGEAIYATILPGEREALHGRLADALARGGTAAPGELAPHWAAAGRTAEALVTSVDAARQAEAVFGLAEALAHLERALDLWDTVPDAAELIGMDLAAVCARAAELASRTGAAPRAVDLAQRAIDVVGPGDPSRLTRVHQSLARYLHESGRTDAGLAAAERAVEFVPAQPDSADRAAALAVLGQALSLSWRFEHALAVSEQALTLARAVGADDAELRALMTVGSALAYLGRPDEGLARLWEAREQAENRGDPHALIRTDVLVTDALMMLGRPKDSARAGALGLEAIRAYGIDSTVLVCNYIEALIAIGEWDEADTASAAAVRAITANFPYMIRMLRADLEVGRGRFDSARNHLEAARVTLREDRGLGIYDVYVAELALWERRWTEADDAVRAGLEMAGSPDAAQIRVWLCAKGLRAQAELAALARARRDAAALERWLDRADGLIATARRAAADAAPITPTAGGWLALAEAEHARARGVAAPERWSDAAIAWERLERAPFAAYCRWREAEALVTAGAPRTEAAVPLRAAHAVAVRTGAQPLARELELLAQRVRVDLAPPPPVDRDADRGPGEALGLTARESDVLTLVARGFTNREIADALVISVKTASVHVSHILSKLGVPNRREAAAVAHRLRPPSGLPAPRSARAVNPPPRGTARPPSAPRGR